MSSFYHILLAHDYVLFRQELRKPLNRNNAMKIAAEVGDDAELYRALEKAPVDKELIMTIDHEEEYLIQLKRVGADEVLLKQFIAANC